mmetsp:Transcript_29803/g.68647  ORF Transcript_29803/g.68647 Transcript_29803/m.68647 type:complete len:210 (-) Transcript_29803:756-1385(-)
MIQVQASSCSTPTRLRRPTSPPRKRQQVRLSQVHQQRRRTFRSLCGRSCSSQRFWSSCTPALTGMRPDVLRDVYFARKRCDALQHLRQRRWKVNDSSLSRPLARGKQRSPQPLQCTEERRTNADRRWMCLQPAVALGGQGQDRSLRRQVQDVSGSLRITVNRWSACRWSLTQLEVVRFMTNAGLHAKWQLRWPRRSRRCKKSWMHSRQP